jgi:hypothetical protein
VSNHFAFSIVPDLEFDPSRNSVFYNFSDDHTLRTVCSDPFKFFPEMIVSGEKPLGLESEVLGRIFKDVRQNQVPAQHSPTTSFIEEIEHV